MRTLAMVMLTLTLAGCAKERESETVVLDSLAQPMCGLASAVVDDGGPKSKQAARRVIAVYDAGVEKPAKCGV